MNILIASVISILISLASSWPDFYFYPKSGNSPVINSLSEEFDATLQSVFIIHGYTDSQNDTKLQAMKNALIKIANVNVIMVDWKEGADADVSLDLHYQEAVKNIRVVGKVVAEFIVSNQIDPQTVTCVGNNLGAHACGFVGKNIQGGLGRISGLDPAGPEFKGKSATERLDSSDAAFVDCIYTSVGVGIEDPICHANFYPNNKVQPQCLPLVVTCDHSASVVYYTLSIDQSLCRFKSTKCSSYLLYSIPLFSPCKCSTIENCVQMGFYTDRTARGNFYLKTYKKAPFCH